MPHCCQWECTSRLPGLYWHCWVGPPAPPQRGGGKHLGATGWGWSRLPPLLPDFITGGVGGVITAQGGWDSRLPHPMFLLGGRLRSGWNGAVQSVSLLSCWEGVSWPLGQRDSFVGSCGLLMGASRLPVSSAPGLGWRCKWKTTGLTATPSSAAALLSSPLPLPEPSHCAVLCCLGFSVGLKGRGWTCPLTSHHVSPSARFESSSQPERAGCLDGLCGCFQDWSSESLSSAL